MIRERMANSNATGGGASDPTAIGHHGHTKIIEEAVAAISENRPSILDGKEGRRSIELISRSTRAQRPARSCICSV